jgi:hypothetical protein
MVYNGLGYGPGGFSICSWKYEMLCLRPTCSPKINRLGYNRCCAPLPFFTKQGLAWVQLITLCPLRTKTEPSRSSHQPWRILTVDSIMVHNGHGYKPCGIDFCSEVTKGSASFLYNSRRTATWIIADVVVRWPEDNWQPRLWALLSTTCPLWSKTKLRFNNQTLTNSVSLASMHHNGHG